MFKKFAAIALLAAASQAVQLEANLELEAFLEAEDDN